MAGQYPYLTGRQYKFPGRSTQVEYYYYKFFFMPVAHPEIVGVTEGGDSWAGVRDPGPTPGVQPDRGCRPRAGLHLPCVHANSYRMMI